MYVVTAFGHTAGTVFHFHTMPGTLASNLTESNGEQQFDLKNGEICVKCLQHHILYEVTFKSLRQSGFQKIVKVLDYMNSKLIRTHFIKRMEIFKNL